MRQGRAKILDRIRAGGLLFDGAMGTMLEARRGELPEFDCGERLVLEKGEVVLDIHRAYFQAGAEAVKTCTFGATPHKLGLYGLEDRVREINVQAAMLVRRAALDFPGGLTAGSMGPTGLLSIETRTDFTDFYRNFYVQAESLLLGGVDVLLLETCNDILEVRAGVRACLDAMERTGEEAVLAVSFTVDASGRMLMGTPLATAAVTVDHMGVDIVGVNCSMGPDRIFEIARDLKEVVSVPLLVMPNRGLPENVGGKAVYTMPPEEFARQTARFRDAGFHCLGGCCGTDPDSIRALKKELAGRPLPPVPRGGRRVKAMTGPFQSVLLETAQRPVLVGERMNYHGSRKFRACVDSGDMDAILGAARRQTERGAVVLDICLATRELTRQVELIRQLLPPLSANVPGPIMVDTTEPEAMEEACRRLQGRGALNSCNLEDAEKARAVFRVAVRHGQMVVCLPIDRDGISRDPEKRLAVARRILDLAFASGLAPEDLVFDPLTLAVATGRQEDRDAALLTLETLGLFRRELSGAWTIMGVSNVSYGLPPGARVAVNNALLDLAAGRGLDFAIFNPMERRKPEEIDPALRELAADLLLNRRSDALSRLLENAWPGDGAGSRGGEPIGSEDPLERVRDMIVRRKRDRYADSLDELLKQVPPRQILDGVFLSAMRELGRLMDEEGLPLPYVLDSASMVQEGMNRLRVAFPGEESGGSGRIVLATVKGDVHDIGKNLVRMLLAHNGYDVIDMGTDVPSDELVKTAMERGADAIGLSALLVSTSREMRRVVGLLHDRGASIPVVVGGAAVSERYAMEINRTEDGGCYGGGVFYGADAFHGLKLFGALVNPESRKVLCERVSKACAEAENMSDAEMRGTGKVQVGHPRMPVFSIPFLEAGIRTFCVGVEVLMRHFDFERRCGRRFLAKGRVEEEFYDSLIRTGHHLMETVQGEVLARPMGVVGFFPVGWKDDALHVVKGEATYPVSLSGSCYRRAIKRDGTPVLPLMVVTLGERLNREIKRRFDEGDYLRGYILSTIAAELAEELAELVTCAILDELGVERVTAVRYSVGYPIWPTLADQSTIFDLLGVEERIGVKLSEGFQMTPEFSVSAGLVHRAT